jgi:pimeloyl-ACP methyl ester carboxylesterase
VTSADAPRQQARALPADRGRPGAGSPAASPEIPAGADDPTIWRARPPDETGAAERDGVQIAWTRYGDRAARTILFLPSWSIVHSRLWKLQIPYFTRRFNVLTFDGRGNGRSDRPATAEAYADAEFAADALAVMDAAGVREAVIVSFSAGAAWALLLAAEHPNRISGAVFLSPSLSLAPPDPARAAAMPPFDAALPTYEGWAKYNRHYWRLDYPGFLEFFFGECLSEPHSTKPIEDCIGWGLETDGETLIRTADAPELGDRDRLFALARSISGPVLVVHGSDDRIVRLAHGAALAELTGGQLITFEGSGHIVCARDPVRTNLAIRKFVDALPDPGG